MLDNVIVQFIDKVYRDLERRHPNYVGTIVSSGLYGDHRQEHTVWDGQGCRLLAHYPGQPGIHIGVFVADDAGVA